MEMEPTHPSARHELATLCKALVSDRILAGMTANTEKLMSALAALSDDQKKSVNAYASGVADKTTGQEEIFVSRHLLETIPVLARNVKALDGFLQAAGDEKATVNHLEIAAGSLRYENFAQFSSSIEILEAALKSTGVAPDLLTLASGIKTDAGTVINALTGGSNEVSRDIDGIFLAAAAAMKGKSPSPDSGRNELENALSLSIETTHESAAPLQKLLENMTPAQNAEIGAVAQDYKQQCGDFGSPLELLANLPVVEAKTSEMARILGSRKTRELTEQENADLRSVFDEGFALRHSVRSLNAVLNTLNKDGQYDESIRHCSEMTGHLWRQRMALSKAGERYQAASIVSPQEAVQVRLPEIAGLTADSPEPKTPQK